MSFLDKLAESNAHIAITEISKASSIDDELRSILYRTIEPKESRGYKKTANYFERIAQTVDVNMHQDDETPDVWIEKKGKLIRITKKFIKN